MPTFETSAFMKTWQRFVNALTQHLGAQPDDRSLDQFLGFRDGVLTLVQDPPFTSNLESCLKEASSTSDDTSGDRNRILNLLQLELDATARAGEVTLSLPETEEKSGLRRMLGRGSTAVKSLKDILEAFLQKYPLLKGGLTLFGELLDIYKGD